MDALDAHPGEGSQEEIVQQPGNDGAEELWRNTRLFSLDQYRNVTWCDVSTRADLVGVHVDPDQEDELGHEEAAAQVLVDGGSGALDLTEEPEGEDAH